MVGWAKWGKAVVLEFPGGMDGGLGECWLDENSKSERDNRLN